MSVIQKYQKIERVIKRIRDSFEPSVEVYTRGGCIKFCMILKEIFNEGVILYDNNHAIFKLEKRYYDITGEVEKGDNHAPLLTYDDILFVHDVMELKPKVKLIK